MRLSHLWLNCSGFITRMIFEIRLSFEIVTLSSLEYVLISLLLDASNSASACYARVEYAWKSLWCFSEKLRLSTLLCDELIEWAEYLVLKRIFTHIIIFMFRVLHAVWLVLWHYILQTIHRWFTWFSRCIVLSCFVPFSTARLFGESDLRCHVARTRSVRQDASCKSLDESAWRVYCARRGGLVTPSHLPNGGLRAFACLSSNGPQDSDHYHIWSQCRTFDSA